MLSNNSTQNPLIDDVYYNVYISLHKLESVQLNKYIRNKVFLQLWSILNNKLTSVSIQQYI